MQSSDLILDSNKIDHVQIMSNKGVLSKDDLPALKALAKFEKVDVSTFDDIDMSELK